MAKRFIDTGFYRSPYVRGLEGPLKALYSFIICDCSGSGIWIKDLEIASIFIGFKISEAQWEIFVDSGKAVDVGGGRFFFPDFIEHQYPNGLLKKNVAHNNFLEELLKLNLLEEEKEGAWKPLKRSLKGPMVMVMVKEEVKVKETVKVTREKKTDSIHNKCIEVYSDFIKNRTGVGPKIGGSGGKAMKTIIEYLSAQIRSSHPEYDTERINLETVSAWNWVLSKFSKWSPFHQEQIKLEQINSNLINIIANIKNPTNARKSAHEQSTDNLRELREKEEQRLTELLVANGHSKKQGSEIISSD